MSDISQLKAALNALVKKHKIGSVTTRPALRRKRPARQVITRFTASGGAEGGGVTSPITETAGTREYHDPVTLTSTDGLFTLVDYGSYAKKIVCTDAVGETFEINLKPPPNDGS